jgi:hypothetical protein
MWNMLRIWDKSKTRKKVIEPPFKRVCAMTIPHLCGMDQNGSTSNNFNLLSRQRQLDKNEKYTNILIGTWRNMLFDSFYICRS